MGQDRVGELLGYEYSVVWNQQTDFFVYNAS
jgi:hypothetical protein